MCSGSTWAQKTAIRHLLASVVCHPGLCIDEHSTIVDTSLISQAVAQVTKLAFSDCTPHRVFLTPCCRQLLVDSPHILDSLLPAWTFTRRMGSRCLACHASFTRVGCQLGCAVKEMTGKYACAGDAVVPNVISWNDLPYDMVELILGKMPLQQLARICTTYSAFLAVCRRKLAQEQKLRCELAGGLFGLEGLNYLALLIDCFVNGDPLDQEVVEKDMQANWVLVEEVDLPDIPGNTSRKMPVYQAGVMCVEVTLANRMSELVLCLPTLKGSMVRLHTRRFCPKQYNITMSRVGDGQTFGVFEGVAFLQSLLSGGWTVVPSELGVSSDVCIGRHFFENQFKTDDLETLQLAPLLPMVSPDTFAILGVGCPSMFNERMQVRHVGWCMPPHPGPHQPGGHGGHTGKNSPPGSVCTSCP
jgi:hypothetical protein